MNPLVLIVTPAYDEWPNLMELRPRVLDELKLFHEDSCWLVVAEHEITNQSIARSFSENHNVRIVQRSHESQNFAAALQIGINSIQEHEYIVFMDGDQSHQPEQISKLIQILEENQEVDIAISSRYIEGGKSENSYLLRVMSRALNIVFRKFLNIRARDLSTNFKAYRADLLKDVELVSQNFEAVEELLLHSSMRVHRELVIKEIPDLFTIRVHGESKRDLKLFIGTYLLSLLVLKRRIRAQEHRKKG